jgi:hypothetical protein
MGIPWQGDEGEMSRGLVLQIIETEYLTGVHH